MRLLHIMSSIDPRDGGPVEGARAMGLELAKHGWSQDIVSGDDPGAHFVREFGQIVHALGPHRAWPGLRSFQIAPGMGGWISRHVRSYDAVLVSGLWSHSALAAWRGLARAGVPYFVYTHGMLDPWFRKTKPIKHIIKQGLWLTHVGKLLNGAEAVLFTTEEERQLAERAFWPYRIRGRVVGYGTMDAAGDEREQIDRFLDRVPSMRGRDFLLFLSRIHEKKGCDLLIRAFASTAARAPDLDLVIAGPDQGGLKDRLAALAGELGIRNRVVFPGMLTGAEKWGALRACRGMALTSHQENFGVVVAEAMAHGKPVLITDKVSIWREVVEDGAGFVEPDTVDGARKLLSRFLDMADDARQDMSERARIGFCTRYRVDRVAEALMAVIEQGKVVLDNQEQC